LSQHGAVDYSGGYVIHMSAGVSGFVAAAIVGKRLARDRTHGVPNNLMLVAAGRGSSGWAGTGSTVVTPTTPGWTRASAVLNTNVATATALLTWMGMDMLFTKQKKPTFLAPSTA